MSGVAVSLEFEVPRQCPMRSLQHPRFPGVSLKAHTFRATGLTTLIPDTQWGAQPTAKVPCSAFFGCSVYACLINTANTVQTLISGNNEDLQNNSPTPDNPRLYL